MQDVQKSPTNAKETARTPETSRSSGGGGLRSALKAMSYEQGVAALSPNGAQTQGDPVQMKVDKSMLESQLASSPTYSGTIDTDTTCVESNEVGEEWVGDGPTRQAYGPPFSYRLISADGKRQYRPPMLKQSGSSRGTAQANFEANSGSGRGFPFNAHVTVTDIDQHTGDGE